MKKILILALGIALCSSFSSCIEDETNDQEEVTNQNEILSRSNADIDSDSIPFNSSANVNDSSK